MAHWDNDGSGQPNLELFKELPVDIWIAEIFGQLPVSTLGVVCLVSKHWKHMAEEDLLWSRVYQRRWKDETNMPAGDTMKQRYRARLQYQIQLDTMPTDVKTFLERLPRIVERICGSDKGDRLQAITIVRKMLSIERNPPIQEVIDAQLVKPLTAVLTDASDPRGQFEAAWCLTNVASGTSAHCAAVVAEGCIPIFVSLLQSQVKDVAEQAVWALGNIAGDCAQMRDQVLVSGAVPAVLALSQSPHFGSVSVMRNTIWTVSNLCRGKPQPSLAQVQPLLPLLSHVIQTVQDDEAVVDALWALSYVADGPDANIRAVLRTGCVPNVVQHMGGRPLMQTPALRLVGNIASGSDDLTAQLIPMGVLPALQPLLTHSKRNMRKEAFWTLSNITASPGLIDPFVQAGLLDVCVAALDNEEAPVAQEAAWTLTNMSSGGGPHIQQVLYNSGAVAALARFATRTTNDRLLREVAETFRSVHKVVGSEIKLAMEDHMDALQAVACDSLSEVLAIIWGDSDGEDDEADNRRTNTTTAE